MLCLSVQKRPFYCFSHEYATNIIVVYYCKEACH
jgi:hypothetical protein